MRSILYPPLVRKTEEAWAGRFPEAFQNTLKLNLGCGRDFRWGDWVNVDYDAPKVDYRVDLTGFPWPFQSNKYGAIVAHQYLEHLPHYIDGEDAVRKTLKEVGRLLKPGGIFIASVPWPNSDVDLSNINHFRRFHPNSFHFLDPASTSHNAGDYNGLRFLEYRILRNLHFLGIDSSYHFPKYLKCQPSIGRRKGIAYLFQKETMEV